MSVKENQSVRNACVLMETIARGQPVGVSDLARRTGINKSAAHRLVVSLRSAGWLQQSDDGRWRIAPALSTLLAAASTDSLVALARSGLEQVRNSTGETAMLVAIDRDKLIVLDVADSPHALRITAPVGSHLPLRNSSALRAIAAHATSDEVAEFRRMDPHLDAETLASIRRRGWALNDREITPDARVVGAAVRSASGRPLAAVIACAPTTRVSLDDMQAIGEAVKAAATALTVSGVP